MQHLEKSTQKHASSKNTRENTKLSPTIYFAATGHTVKPPDQVNMHKVEVDEDRL